MQGNARIVIDSGPVIFQVAGQSLGPSTPAIQIAGNGISNTSYDPTQLQFVYAGTGTVSLTGGAETSALVYAAKCHGKLRRRVRLLRSGHCEPADGDWRHYDSLLLPVTDVRDERRQFHDERVQLEGLLSLGAALSHRASVISSPRVLTLAPISAHRDPSALA